jgi:hypothetical protein
LKLQIDLKRHRYTLYREDVPVAHFSNERLACETAFLRWKWNPDYPGDGMLYMRGKPIPHSVKLPDGRFVHANMIAMDGWRFDRVLQFSREPMKAQKPEQAPQPLHWAVM